MTKYFVYLLEPTNHATYVGASANYFLGLIIGFEFERPGWSGGSHFEPFNRDDSLNRFGEILGGFIS